MKKLSPLKIVIIFLVCGQLWIFLTDLLVASVATSSEMFTRLSVLKGWLYNLVIGLLLFWLISRYATERDRVDEALRDSERSYKTLSENLPGIIYRVFSRENNRMQFFNKTAFEITGYLDSELSLGEICSLEVLILDEDRPNVLAAVEKAITEHKQFSIEYRLRHKDGSIGFLLEKGTPIYGPDEKILYIDGVIFDITERKQVEDALKKTTRGLQEAQHLAHMGRWELDLLNNHLTWSDEIYRMFEVDAKKFGASYEAFLQAIHPDDRDAVNAAYTNSLKTRAPYIIDHRLLFPDGRIKYVNEQCETLFENGKPIRSTGVVQDITERKRAELTLRNSEKKLSEALRVAHMGYWEFDVKTELFTFNDQYYSLHGLIASQAGGYQMTAEEFARRYVHPADALLVGQTIRLAIETTDPDFEYQTEGRILHADGTVRWATIWFRIEKDNQGKTSKMYGVNQDITARKRFEQQTKDALNFIRAMMENSPIGIISINATGAVVAANEAIARITGGTVDQLLKKDVRFLDSWMKYGLLSAMDEALATNSEKRIETHYVSSFGKDAWLSVSFVPYTYEGEPHVLTLLADISERKRYETEKERFLTQLMHVQKMDAIGQLAGGVAHDFNNILTAIIGYGSILQKKMTPNDPLRGNVDQILTSAGRAAQLTSSLLAFGRKHVLNMKPTPLNGIIARQEQFLHRIIGEDIELKSILRGDAVIMADSGQIEQVLMNLATNARDAMPKGGHLTIETDMMEMTDAFISAYGFGDPGIYAVIAVTDTGSGMDEEAKQKIFEPFFTTKEVGRGTGLGMAIVYGIVKQHKGYINVYSQVGTGTTFKIYLPIYSGQAEQQTVSLVAPPAMTGTETILLAEDDAILRTFFIRILTEHGYTVIVAEDGEDAISKFFERKDEIQLCILDMIMPKKSGKEVFDAIQKINPGIKVIFSSGYTADKVLREGLPVGITFIAKPAPPQDYLKKIREVLDSALTE